MILLQAKDDDFKSGSITFSRDGDAKRSGFVTIAPTILEMKPTKNWRTPSFAWVSTDLNFDRTCFVLLRGAEPNRRAHYHHTPVFRNFGWIQFTPDFERQLLELPVA
jgi:hypothetical protein